MTSIKLLITTFICFFPTIIFAVPVVFNNSTLFASAISGFSTKTLNFESVTAGHLIADGGTLNDITFHYSNLALDGVKMIIRNDFSTTSAANYLGTNDPDGLLQGGDAFSLSFAPVNAIGMFFLSGDQLEDNDIVLNVNNLSGTTDVFLSSVAEATLSDGSFVHFLGMVDDTNIFTSVTISSDCIGCFAFNIDDITTSVKPVPIPLPFWLFLTSIIPLLHTIKKQHFQHDTSVKLS